MDQVLTWVADGKLKPHVHMTYPLARTAEAIKSLETRTVAGKVILTI
jgi:NADPH2:quinone reductase